MKKADLAESLIVVPGDAIKLVRSCTVHQSPHALYEFCRDPRNLTKLTPHRLAVSLVSPVEARWEMMGPGQELLAWTTLLINDEPDRLLAWRSREGGAVAHAGSIRFEPVWDHTVTLVTVKVDYAPPGGKLGEFLARISGWDLECELEDVLYRLQRRFDPAALAARAPDRRPAHAAPLHV